MAENDKQKAVSKTTEEKPHEEDHPHIRHVVIDFGKVDPFVNCVKACPIDNLKNNESMCYKIVRDPETSPLYHLFNFNKYEGVVKSKECINLKVTYSPIIPFRIDIDHFEFVDSSFNIIKIKTVGHCIGPILKASVKEIRFLATPHEKTRTKTFELNNISETTAEFWFDCDNDHNVFKIEPRKSTIKAKKHAYIQVQFIPPEFGCYSYDLFCLVWGGTPLLIELRGIYRETDRSVLESTRSYFENFKDHSNMASGHVAYMEDCPNAKRSSRAVIMSRNYVNFGRLLVGSEQNSNIQLFTLTNNLRCEITIKWPDNAVNLVSSNVVFWYPVEENSSLLYLSLDEIFDVIPKKINVLPQQAASFRCLFLPKSNNLFYYRMLTAQIMCKTEKPPCTVLPYAASIKFQGHSFPEDEFWIPNIEVCPRVITITAGSPGYPSFASFKVRVIGHLPVMFRLIPPKKTNLTLKPMIGIIYKYQIVVIQLYYEGPEDMKQFKEVWHLEPNDLKEKQIPICIRGEITTPKIIIGENDTVTFDDNQPGCERIGTVPLRNTSGYQVRYEFLSTNYENLQIHPSKGVLPSNEMVSIKFSYTGSLEFPKNLQLTCNMQRIHKTGELVGRQYKHKFNIVTNCVCQQLCSTPTYDKFGEVQLDTQLDTEFHIFNFGKVSVNYLLQTTYDEDNLDRFKVSPHTGTIEAESKVRICVTGKAKTLGSRTVRISYHNRKRSDAEEVADVEAIQLFQFTYTASLPILQISEIVEHNFGPLFSKEHFWNYLKIDKLNDVLQSMTKGETRSVQMYLPEVEVSDDIYYVTLLMENRSVFEVDINLKRKKMCDCVLKEVSVNINVSKKEYDCQHREMLCVELPEKKFYENTRQILTINVRYILEGESNMCYLLELPHQRTIEIIITMFSIPNDAPKLSCYVTQFNMDFTSVSLLRRVPPIHICWCYNNTNVDVSYKLDETNISQLCQQERYEIIKCINPEGTVRAHSNLALMFRFQPIEVTVYTIETTLTCGAYTYDFHIQGAGKLEISTEIFSNLKPITSNRWQFLPVLFSNTYIPINNMLTWCVTERVIFIKNVAKDKAFKFYWEDYFFRVGIDNILELTVTQKSGVLRPLESQAVIIKVKTFNEACITSVALPCHLVDHTHLVLHQKSEQQQVHKEQNVEFSPTEEESELAKSIRIEHPKSYAKTVVIRVHIVHSNDKDKFFSMEEQFKCNPQDQISIDVNNMVSSEDSNWTRTVNKGDAITREDRAVIAPVLEKLIADHVFSNSIRGVLDYVSTSASPIYEQFKMDTRKIMEQKRTTTPLSGRDLQEFRKKQIKHLFTRPKQTLMGQVVKDLIINGIHDALQLGPFTSNQVENEVVPAACSPECKCEKHKIKNV